MAHDSQPLVEPRSSIDPSLEGYLSADEVAELLEWLASEIQDGELRITSAHPERGEQHLCLELDSRLRSRVTAKQTEHRGRLKLSLDWEAITYGPLEIVVD